MLGYLDLWLGAPQETGLPAYDIDSVKGSVTNVILSSDEALTNEKILTLRNTAKISCSFEYNANEYNPCQPTRQPCLFNIFEDPCERHNLYDQMDVQIVQKELETKINEFRKTKVKVEKLKPDKLSNPALYNNTWVSWGDVQKYSVIGI